MNFYSVPAILYQQQEKLKQKSKKSTRRSSRKNSSSDNHVKSPLSSIPKDEDLKPENNFTSTEERKTRHHSSLNKKSTNSSNSSCNSPSLARINSKFGEPLPIYASKNHESDIPRISQDELRRPSISSSMLSFVSGKFGRSAKLQLSQSSTPQAMSIHSIERQDAKSENLADHPEQQDIMSHRYIPDFMPILDLSVLNNSDEIKKQFFNPESLRQRYQTFLSILSEHHINDPINFASVREQSLRSFVKRLKQSQNHNLSGSGSADKGDMNFHEDSLTYELIKIRYFLRKQIKDESIRQKRDPDLSMMEELLHSNFFNYVRYLVNLPDIPSHSAVTLSEIQRKHYEYRSFFHDMSAIIYAKKKEGFEDEVSTFTSRMQLLVQAILKASYEFILLEKYMIQILVKLNNDFLIESRITRNIFDLYNSKLKTGDKESVKALVLNSLYSVNYSWYLAITIPFVRFFETSIFYENFSSLLNDTHSTKSSRKSPSEQFKSLDEALFENYFGLLNLTDFNVFASMSRKKLVKLQENYSSSSSNTGAKNDIKSWRPTNFEYYTKSLSSIDSDSFHVIHIRDFQVQFNSTNYRGILAELGRILRSGGYLEIPLIVSGKESLKITWDVFRDSIFASYNEGEEDSKQTASATLRDLFLELSRIFGDKSVKFTTVLLTEKNEMNRFLLNNTLFKAFEVHGHFDKCENLLSEKTNAERDSMNYYIYIQVKSCK